MWDKDFKKADDLIATGDVTLPQGLEGSMSVCVKGVDGNDDVQALNFSFSLVPEEEEEGEDGEESGRKKTARPLSPPGAAERPGSAASGRGKQTAAKR